MGAEFCSTSLYRGSLYQGLSVVCIYNYTSCHFGVANFLQGDRLHLFKFGVTRQVSDIINKKKLSLREENLKNLVEGFTIYVATTNMASSFIRAATSPTYLCTFFKLAISLLKIFTTRPHLQQKFYIST